VHTAGFFVRQHNAKRRRAPRGTIGGGDSQTFFQSTPHTPQLAAATLPLKKALRNKSFLSLLKTQNKNRTRPAAT